MSSSLRCVSDKIYDNPNHKLGEFISCPYCNESDITKALNKKYEVIRTYKTKDNVDLERYRKRKGILEEGEEYWTEDRICSDCNKKYSFEVVSELTIEGL